MPFQLTNFTEAPHPMSTEIVSCRIHPGIGIARIGNSPDDYFIGPEAPGAVPDPPGGFKDASGRIKRQAARFRIYGLNAASEVVKELTAADAEIVWTVHLANKKAAWFGFDVALDLPGAPTATLRNADYQGDRRHLVIDPGPRSLTGRHASARHDQGMFLGLEVPLGESLTDDAGRLLVLGGVGQSGSVLKQVFIENVIEPFWYDDISDGPVSATVKLNGVSLPVTPAWALVGPPDYAPGIKSLVTLYDIAYEVATRRWLKPPESISFTEHILPIFERFHHYQWVNEGFYLDYGSGAPDDFLSSENLPRLASKTKKQQPLRQKLFSQFRNPDYVTAQPDALPPMYGDAIAWPPDGSNPRKWLALPQLQYDWLERWAQGDFEADWRPEFKRSVPAQLEDLPSAEQPQALDRAALENCVGGAFHPGHEVTWPMRRARLYDAPFRIKPRTQPEKDYGLELTPDEALAEDGPLDGSTPGDLTRWMSLPWQADAAQCGAGYQPTLNPFLPTFWPARVPNQVLLERHYQATLNPDISPAQRQKYFNLRQDWLRDLAMFPDLIDRVNQFQKDWAKLGIVVRREVPSGYPDLPSHVHVEVGNELEKYPDQRYRLLEPRRPR